MAPRLNVQTLRGLQAIQKPSYDRKQVVSGIVHLGIGAFHRAHQAVYTDTLLASGDYRWGITGVSLRSSSTREALAPQDFLYTVQTLGEQPDAYRIVGSVVDALTTTQPAHLVQLTERLAHPATQVITLTVTEKGYCSDHLGGLDRDHPDIVYDLAHPNNPRSAPGLLALGLRQRRVAGTGPITILSCDNLARNGSVTANVVRALLQSSDAETARWLDDNVRFPASMVDRIVPQTHVSDLQSFEALSGYQDLALVAGEPFTQWVIEDQFAGARPAWDVAGAQFVSDVVPFEQAKLRLLNATHSALAYLGLLAGHDYVHEAMADPALASFARELMDVEITPVVNVPPGMDLNAYKADILRRFANAAVPYRTHQVAADGSQKLVQRILPTIATRLQAGGSIDRLSAVVAAWLRCLEGKALPTAIDDPSAGPIKTLCQRHSDPGVLVDAIATETAQFGDLATSRVFRAALTAALVRIS